MDQKTHGADIAYLFLTFFLWGSVYVAGKLGSAQIPPFLLSALRCAIATPVLLVMARRHLPVRIDPADRKLFLAVGVLGYYLTFDLVQLGVSLTGASTAALVNSFNPVAIMLLAAVFLKEKITPVKLLCLALAMTGTLVVAGGAHGKGETLGILSTLLATVTWGACAVCIRSLTAKYPAILVTAYGMAVSLLLHIPTGLIDALRRPPQLDLRAVLTVLYLALAGTAFAQFTWAKALAGFPAGTCSLFYPLQAVFSALLGAVVLNEKFTASFFIGLAFVAADVILSTWETTRGSRKTMDCN
ncbi:MAG: DMT family transporter [Ruminococcaceae bacterium]|nr:DMT family transporter [Oscillospiraceae bacterium]